MNNNHYERSNIIGVWAGATRGYTEIEFDSSGVMIITKSSGLEDFYEHLYRYPSIRYYDTKQLGDRRITLTRDSSKYEIDDETITLDNGISSQIYQIDSTILVFMDRIYHRLPDTLFSNDDFRISTDEDTICDFTKDYINRAIAFEKKHKIVYR